MTLKRSQQSQQKQIAMKDQLLYVRVCVGVSFTSFHIPLQWDREKDLCYECKLKWNLLIVYGKLFQLFFAFRIVLAGDLEIMGKV